MEKAKTDPLNEPSSEALLKLLAPENPSSLHDTLAYSETQL